MTYLTDLDQALRARGIPYVEVGYSPLSPEGAADWRSRGRPGRAFDPEGVLCHHTATPEGVSTQASLNVVLRGNSQAPGPIAQVFISREPKVYLVAAGLANHGGGGIRPGIDSSCQSMNRLLLGIEVDNNGVGERWGDAQVLLYASVVEALCHHYGWPISAVWLHATTGPPSGGCNSKIDPAGPWHRQPDLRGTWDLATWRAYCAEQGNGPTPIPVTGDEMHVIYESIDASGNRWAWADFMGIEDGNGICESIVWIDGNYKAQLDAAAPGKIPHKRRAPGGYKTFRLEGGKPQGDQQYSWNDGDFRKVT